MYESYVIAVTLGFFACITDYLDGYLARNKGMATPIGEILDQFGDSVSTACIIALGVYLNGLPFWYLFLFLLREFWVYSIRRYVSQKGKNLPSIFLGKLASNFLFWGAAVYFFGYAKFLPEEYSYYIRALGYVGFYGGLIQSYGAAYIYSKAFFRIYDESE